MVVSTGPLLSPITIIMISQPDDGDMMGDYPSDSEAPSDTEESSPETVDEEEASNASKTILAPKAAVGSMTKVGDKCMMRVVADHGDEVELEYVTSPDKENKQESMSSDEEIEAMDRG